MKKTIIVAIIVLIAYCSGYSQTVSLLDNDPVLKDCWLNFKSAVKKADVNTLKILCADSVKFSMYMGNQELIANESLELSESDCEKKNLYTNFFYMPQESFVTEELSFVFDNNVISRMDDISMLRIIKSNGVESEYQVFITVSDPDEEFAGTEMGLIFKKEKGTFLLCGIDTIQ